MHPHLHLSPLPAPPAPPYPQALQTRPRSTSLRETSSKSDPTVQVFDDPLILAMTVNSQPFTLQCSSSVEGLEFIDVFSNPGMAEITIVTILVRATFAFSLEGPGVSISTRTDNQYTGQKLLNSLPYFAAITLTGNDAVDVDMDNDKIERVLFLSMTVRYCDDPLLCEEPEPPTFSPTMSTTQSPTFSPTTSPTQSPTKSPTRSKVLAVSRCD